MAVTRLAGEVDLEFGTGEYGRTRLERRFRTGHFHVAKPYHDGRQLVVQVVNTTAGIFENDTLKARYFCGSGARACLLSPSSSQVYTMPSGGEARSEQLVKVRSGGSLAVLPRWLVPHRGSRFCQTTRIELEPGARLLYLEPVSAGRVSFGEFLEMDSLSCRVEIRHDNKLVLRENLAIGSRLNRWILEREGCPRFPYLAAAYISFPGAAGFCERKFAELPADGAESRMMGMTALTDELVVVRLLGRESTEVLATLKALYRILESELPISPVLQRI